MIYDIEENILQTAIVSQKLSYPLRGTQWFPIIST